MRCFRPLAFLCIALFCGFTRGYPAALQLTCKIGEERAPLVAIERSQLIVDHRGTRVAVSANSHWEIIGDIDKFERAGGANAGGGTRSPSL